MSDTAVHGMNSVVLMDDVSLREMGTSVRNNMSRQDVDVSVFGMTDVESISGMRNASLNFEGIRKGDLAAYQRLCRSAIGTENTNHMMSYGPDGPEVGKQAFLMNSNQNSFEVNSPYAGAVMITAVFAATGGPRLGVFLSSAHGNSVVTTPEVKRLIITDMAPGDITLSAVGDTADAVFAPDALAATIVAEIEGMFPAFVGQVTAIPDVSQNADADEIQGITLTGGSFSWGLVYSGQDTGLILGRNATAEQVQAALEGLSNIAPGDVEVTGVAGSFYEVRFKGALAGTNVAQMTATLPGTGVSIATTQQGGAVGVFNGIIDLQFDDSLGNVVEITTATPGVDVQTMQIGGLSTNLNIVTVTANGASQDNGAATTNGYTAHLHNIFANSATATLTVRIQHSVDNAVWADLVVFNVLSIKGSQRVTNKTATVNRYTRVRWEIAGTSPGFAFAVPFSRYGNVVWSG